MELLLLVLHVRTLLPQLHHLYMQRRHSTRRRVLVGLGEERFDFEGDFEGDHARRQVAEAGDFTSEAGSRGGRRDWTVAGRASSTFFVHYTTIRHRNQIPAGGEGEWQ